MIRVMVSLLSLIKGIYQVHLFIVPSALGSAPRWQAGSGFGVSGMFAPSCALFHDVGNPYGCVRDFG